VFFEVVLVYLNDARSDSGTAQAPQQTLQVEGAGLFMIKDKTLLLNGGNIN
jgi:hypothetical protein